MDINGILICLDLRNQERGMLQKLLYLQGVMFASGFLLPSIAPVAAILVQHYGGFEMSVPKVIYVLYSKIFCFVTYINTIVLFLNNLLLSQQCCSKCNFLVFPMSPNKQHLFNLMLSL